MEAKPKPVVLSTFQLAADQRCFEDYVPGAVFEFGTLAVTDSDIIRFAEQFDPQGKHISPDKAALGPFGGVIASGWHTAGVMMRLFTDHYLPSTANLVSPGVDELRWTKPVRPGDSLRIRVTVVEARRSRSKPDRGLVRSFVEVLNQKDEVVMTLLAMNLMKCKDAATVDGKAK